MTEVVTAERSLFETRVLTATFSASILLAWLLEAILGRGSNAGYIVPACLCACLVFDAQRLKARWDGARPVVRIALAQLSLLLLAAQVVHFGSWRLHRDSVGLVATAITALSIADLEAPLRALRRLGVFYLLLFAAIAAFAPQLGVYEIERFGGPQHPNATSLQILLAFTAIYWMHRARPWTVRLSGLAAVIVILVCNSRAAFFLLAVPYLVSLATSDETKAVRRRRALSYFGVSAAAAVALATVLRNLLLRDASVWDLVNLSGRTSIWPYYVDLALVDPLFGQGDGGLFQAVDFADGHIFEVVHAHNAFLSLAAMYGIPFMLAVAALAVIAVERGIRWVRATATGTSEGSTARAYLSILIASLAAGSLEPMVVNSSNVGAAVTWLTLLTCLALPTMAGERAGSAAAIVPAAQPSGAASGA
jgi:hypothetical protein